MTTRRCAGCGRPLPASRGPYGPVCAQRLGLTTTRRAVAQPTARPTPAAPPGQAELPLIDDQPDRSPALTGHTNPTRYELAPGCPHCPDGHTPPDGGSQSWAVWISDARDGDGQPTTIHVARSAGAHVAESDAQWIRERLNQTRTSSPNA